MAFSGEILSQAPYYQNIRKHSTLAGDIICTGAGCIGCSPQKNADENIAKMLGDVDSFNFQEKTGNERKHFGKRPVTAPGCHGDETGISNEGKNAQDMKDKSSKKLKTNRSKKILKEQNNTTFIEKGAKLKRNSQIEASQRKKQVTFKCSFKETELSRNKQMTIDQRRSLYNTFPGRVQAQLSANHRKHSKTRTNKTSFLDMLKSCESGIYDMRILERNHSSIWIEKIKEKGVREEDLLPKITRTLMVRNSGDGSEREMADKHIQTIKIDRIKQPLPHLSLNNRVQTRGGESILVIEHDHDSKTKLDKTLYRLGFCAETSQSHRKFPNVSIIEIADSLGEFVDMGAIKVIQRRNKKWIVLVEGKTIKEFLLENGVVLGGRHFDIFEIKTF